MRGFLGGAAVQRARARVRVSTGEEERREKRGAGGGEEPRRREERVGRRLAGSPATEEGRGRSPWLA
jgi:hypothetical protein